MKRHEVAGSDHVHGRVLLAARASQLHAVLEPVLQRQSISIRDLRVERLFRGERMLN